MRRTLLAAVAVVATVASAFAITAAPAGANPLAVTDTDTEAVVLPSRVANAIHRAQLLLDAASTAIDTGDSTTALASLKAIHNAVARADRAARAQMNAPADPNAEEGATTGPDSVIAVLTVEQGAITTLVDLFDLRSGTNVDALTHALFAALNMRDQLLAAVIALPADGAGADYADGMADTAAGYDDEVANITEALQSDTLSAGGKKVLQAALAQSQKAEAAFAAAFGGGE